jgi:ATP-binding cassette subfamily B protein
MKTETMYEARVRMTYTNYALDHSYKYFSDNFAGSLSNKISDITKGSRDLLKIIHQKIVPTLFTIIFTSAVLFDIKWQFSAIILTWAGIHLLVKLISAKKWSKAGKIHSESRSTLTGKIVDAITNHAAIKSFANKKHEIKFITKYQNDELKKHRLIWWFILKVIILLQVIYVLIPVIGLMAYEIYAYMQGAITLSEFVYILIATPPVVGMVWELGFYIPDFSHNIGMVRQAIETLNKKYDVTNKKGAKKLKVTQAKIEFKNVSFKYKKNYVFKDKNLIIPGGQKVGLVGRSGAGKTTFVNLILRYFDIQKGEIIIDNQNIAKVTQESLRTNIALIPQDTALFHRPLIENIRYGKLNATDKEVVAASKKAYAHDFIQELDEKYQSMVGERGIKLSGGQRQRIAIARAILKDAPILILDEATSALDSESEQYIQKSLKNLMKGKTVIAVAHRLSTLLNMDRILVFEKGKIVEDGSHSELLKKGGYYAKLWKMQAGGFIKE